MSLSLEIKDKIIMNEAPPPNANEAIKYRKQNILVLVAGRRFIDTHT